MSIVYCSLACIFECRLIRAGQWTLAVLLWKKKGGGPQSQKTQVPSSLILLHITGHLGFAVLQCISKSYFQANLTLRINYFWAMAFKLINLSTVIHFSLYKNWNYPKVPCSLFFNYLSFVCEIKNSANDPGQGGQLHAWKLGSWVRQFFSLFFSGPKDSHLFCYFKEKS